MSLDCAPRRGRSSGLQRLAGAPTPLSQLGARARRSEEAIASKYPEHPNPESPSMADLTLYHAAPSRSSIVHWMLEEVGEPYDIHLVSFKKGENRAPAYLAVNPMGKVPALRHRDVVITEASAICAYLADEFPRAKLSVPVGNPRPGMYLKWLFFGPSCVEPTILEKAYPRKDPAPRAALGFV